MAETPNEMSDISAPAIKAELDSPQASPTDAALAPDMAAAPQDAAMKLEHPTQVAPEASRGSQNVSLRGLRDLADSEELDVLEAGVSAASAILDELRKPMTDFSKCHSELLNWLNMIGELQSRIKKPDRTVVAVAGATGAGKSSLINAIIGEEKLLPTNSMRACTAVTTELLYNKSQDPQKAYRAEVEFISQRDWDTELDLLFKDLLDETDQRPSAWRDHSSDAGIAYAKVQAVYPDLSHEELVKSKPKELASNQAVARLLGTKKKLVCATAREMHTMLSRFLDSKEKGSKTKEMALWPIIRAVRIFTRADALSTSVCLVDLPGTLDSNAARSAVANKYIMECTDVWIAARISRAVDDKAAKDLLGRLSRIQMKLDGAYNYVTFIATQTDGIDIRDTIDSLDEDGEIQATITREVELRAAIVETKKKVHNLQKRLDDLEELCRTLEAEEEVWDGLKEMQKHGQQVYMPVITRRPNGSKRRRRGQQKVANESHSADGSEKVPLAADEISAKLTELRASADANSDEMDEMERRCEAAKSVLAQLQKESEDVAVERPRMCVQKRNAYCRDAIRQDFAAGIREIDEEDGQNGTRDGTFSVQQRDYEKVAQSLPVFCISSKAYQQMRNDECRNASVEGFRVLEDTGIPQLQAHAKKASQSGRLRSRKAVLNQFCQLSNSLIVWLSAKPSQTPHLQAYEMKFLETQIAECKTNFARALFELQNKLQKIVRDVFWARTSNAVDHAARVIGDTTQRWGKTEMNGGFGIQCNTYKAICRREGEKTSARRARNFNADVLEPYMHRISGCWEQAFSRDIPTLLDGFADMFKELLYDFHAQVLSRAKSKSGTTLDSSILGEQLETHQDTIEDAIHLAKMQVQAQQRVASRLLQPEIKEGMKPIYAKCGAATGSGSYQRMRDDMDQYILTNKFILYKNAGKKVVSELELAFQDITNGLSTSCEHIRATLARDYQNAISRSEVVDANPEIRDRIRDVLSRIDPMFTAIRSSAQAVGIDPMAGMKLDSAACPEGPNIDG